MENSHESLIKRKKSYIPVSDISNSNEDEPESKKSKKKQNIPKLIDENVEPLETDLKIKKKSKKTDKSQIPQFHFNDSSESNEKEPMLKKSKKKQNISNLNYENLEISETDLKTKKSNKIYESPQTPQFPINDNSKSNDLEPKLKKSKKKRKNNSKLIKENQDPSKIDLTPKERSKKMNDFPENPETGKWKSDHIKKQKLKKSITVKSEKVDKSNNTVGVGSEDDEINDDFSSDDESDISDAESANSVSSFNIDSYPSDDESSEDEEAANKKHGLPVGAVPSAELEEKENRTIFVGNLPKAVERHELRKWFSRFGKVECVRLRSAPIADLELPKKVAVIKKSFHENRSNIHAYIRYKDIEGAQNALQANGTKYGEYTLRVDHARHKGGYDGKKAVFVGNVPFSIEENSLISLFSKCGDIDAVRIIRDKETGVGKGFAYVNFKCSSSVPLALKLDGEVLEKRQLRVKPIKYNGKTNNKLPSNFSQKRNNFKFKSGSREVKTKGFGKMQNKHSSSKPPFKKNKFQGELSKRKEKRRKFKKSLDVKKREIYSKILTKKKKTD